MPTPKSVTKVDKNGYITFTDDVSKAEYFLFELTRGALRDVGKYLKKQWKITYYQHFKKHTGEGAKATTVQVISSKNTKYPRLDIGLPHSHKGKPVRGFYSYFQEFGSSKTPKLGLLQNLVKNNIATIREIEAKYLDYINKDDSAIESKIEEGEILDED